MDLMWYNAAQAQTQCNLLNSWWIQKGGNRFSVGEEPIAGGTQSFSGDPAFWTTASCCAAFSTNSTYRESLYKYFGTYVVGGDYYKDSLFLLSYLFTGGWFVKDAGSLQTAKHTAYSTKQCFSSPWIVKYNGGCNNYWIAAELITLDQTYSPTGIYASFNGSTYYKMAPAGWANAWKMTDAIYGSTMPSADIKIKITTSVSGSFIYGTCNCTGEDHVCSLSQPPSPSPTPTRTRTRSNTPSISRSKAPSPNPSISRQPSLDTVPNPTVKVQMSRRGTCGSSVKVKVAINKKPMASTQGSVSYLCDGAATSVAASSPGRFTNKTPGCLQFTVNVQLTSGIRRSFRCSCDQSKLSTKNIACSKV